MNKPITLTFHYFGKTVTVKDDTNVLHLENAFNMFKSIVISEFGQEDWEKMIYTIANRQADKVISEIL